MIRLINLLFAVLFVLGCGGSQRTKLLGVFTKNANPIAVAIFTADKDLNQVRVQVSFNSPTKPTLFEYCQGDFLLCQSDAALRKPLVAEPQIPEIANLHSIPEAITLTQDLRLHFFATAPNSPEPTVLSIRFTDKTAIQIGAFDFSQAELLSAKPNLNGLEYDYDAAMQQVPGKSVNLKVRVNNPQVLGMRTSLAVIVGGYALNDTSTPVFRHSTAKMDEAQNLVISADGFADETVYKVRLYFFETQVGGAAAFVGAASQEYFFVTGKEGNPVAAVRAQMVTKSLAEYNAWELGRYDRSKGYANRPSWCVEFVRWNHLPFLQESMEWFSPTEFRRFSADFSGGDIIRIAGQEPIHGDYVRIPGHSFLLLAYDQKTQKVWTIEGNFSNRVEIHTRSISSGWQVGHIVGPMLK